MSIEKQNPFYFILRLSSRHIVNKKKCKKEIEKWQKSLLILNPLESSSCFTACFSHPCWANPKESARATKKSADFFSPQALFPTSLFFLSNISTPPF